MSVCGYVYVVECVSTFVLASEITCVCLRMSVRAFVRVCDYVCVCVRECVCAQMSICVFS